MSEGYYRDPQFCLECAYQHSRDVEHHLEDWEKFTPDREQKQIASELKDKQRVIRKEIDDWRLKLRESSESEKNPNSECVGCEGIVKPGDLNPEIPEICEFQEEKVRPKEYFDRTSFRTLCPECPMARCAMCPPELACASRIIIGCKTGEFVEGRCRIGTETHVIYHGKPKGGEEV